MVDQNFDLRLVAAQFRACVRNMESGAQDVAIDNYVQGYNELNKSWGIQEYCLGLFHRYDVFRLFYRLGRMFSFIANDIKEKTHILAQHRQSVVGDGYETVNRMMTYEKHEAQLFVNGRKPGPKELPNGSRTILRLHRALAFVVKLIEGIRVSREGDKMCELTKKAYRETLAPYHTWAVRKLVNLAVTTLPTRSRMFEILAGPVPMAEVDGVLTEMVAATNAVYEIVQRLFERHQLLELP